MMCIGHRGAAGHLPENTLPAFEHALTLGCNWIELDVRLAAGEIIVIHDKTLDRTTSGAGPVRAMTLAQLRSLDAGGGARIPTLKEVIDLIDHRCGVNIELKGGGTAAPVCRLLDRYCDHGWTPAEFLLSSFDHDELALADPGYPRSLLFDKPLRDTWARAVRLGAWSVSFRLPHVTGSLVDEAHARGCKILVYTVNEPADIKRMVALGVDGIFSDFPDRVSAVLA